ncbi:MAG: hypothetical protein ACR2KO_14840 [Geodermatophilaceae bacterium]
MESGRIDGYCVSTSNPGGSDEQRQLCVTTATIGIANGETEIEMTGVGRIESEDVVFAVTGGTGKYANARGQVTVDYSDDRGIKLRFTVIP